MSYLWTAHHVSFAYSAMQIMPFPRYFLFVSRSSPFHPAHHYIALSFYSLVG